MITFPYTSENNRFTAGGIVAHSINSTISRCNTLCNSNSYSDYNYDEIGGIVGLASNSEISSCSTTVNIGGKWVGGIVGVATGDSVTIFNCESISGALRCDIASSTTSFGGILGKSQCLRTSITACKNRGLNISGNSSIYIAGGIIGLSTQSTFITDCENHGVVYAKEACGGICGSANVVTIVRCCNYGTVHNFREYNSTIKSYAGGIVGRVYSSHSTIQLCFNKGDISGNGYYYHNGSNYDYSGFLGGITTSDSAHVINCYNTANINVAFQNSSCKKAFIYGISRCNITNSYSTGVFSGYYSSRDCYGVGTSNVMNSYYKEGCGTDIGGSPRTSANMKSVSFPLILNTDSVVFDMDINNENDGYPILHWTTRGMVFTDSVEALHSNTVILKGHYTGTADSCGYIYRRVGNDGSFNRVFLDSVAQLSIFPLSGLTANSQYEYCFFKYWDGIAMYGDTLQFTTFPLYTVAVSSSNSAWGSVSGNGTFPHGAIDTLTATAFANYRFLQWSDGNNNNPRYLTITQNETLTAQFGPAIYNITVASNNNAWGSVSGSGSFNYNASATITATPAPHYHFVSWSDGNTSNPRTLIVTFDLSLTATFAPDQYTITSLPNNATWGSTTGSGTFTYGDIDTLTATPFEHYRFTGWSDGNTNNPRYLTVMQDSSFTAMFVYDAYNLSLSTNNQAWGTVSGNGLYEYGSQATATATPAEHYHFVSWDDGNTSNPRSLMITTDVSLQAIFAPDNYTVTVQSSNPAWGSTTGSGSFAYGSIDTITATAIGQHVFAHWNDGTTSNPRHFTVLGDTTITAVFAPSSCTLTVTVNNTLWGSASGGGTFQYGQTAYCTAMANAGYHFVQWSDGNTDNPRVYTLEDNTTLQAIFAPNQYTITLTANDTTKGSVSGGGTYDYQQQIYIIAIPADGYTFSQWSDGNTTSYRQITVTQDMTYTAVFTDIIYTITVTSSNPTYGYVTGGGQYARNSIATLTAIPNQGYHFAQWSDGNTQNPRTVTVTGNMTYFAQFAPDQYTITVNSANIGQGTATGSGVFGYGTQTTIEATPMQHHRFLHWNDGITTNPRIITVAGDSTFTAYFEPEEQYTVNVVSANPERGTVSGGGTYYNGEQITITASAFSGYTFDHWSDGNTESTRTITVAHNTTYTAYFAAPTYTVNVSCNQNEGEVSGGGTYEQGATVTVTATPKTGYHFTRWSNGVESDVYSFEIFNNVNLVAYFESTTGISDVENPFNVTVVGTLVTITGADNMPVLITDIIGRTLYNSKQCNGETIDVQQSGVYLIKVGNATAKKIVIIK